MPGWDRIYSHLVGRDSGLALPPLPRPFASTPAADVAAAVSAGKAVIVDVRPADRFDVSTAVGALSIPLYDKPDFSKPSFGGMLKAALLAANGVQPVDLRPTFAADVAAAVAAPAVVFLIDEAGGTLEPTATFPAGKASRSLQAAFKLLEAGWPLDRVGHVEGGLALYAAEGLPLTAPFDGKEVGRSPAGVRKQ